MKKLLGQILLIAIVAAAMTLLVMRAVGMQEQGSAVAKAESVYERVIRTRTVRCGYIIKPPFISKDPNTGKVAGLYVDFMEAFAEVTDLKIEWTSELNLGTYLEDLASGRYDMECAAGWQNAKRGQRAFYPQPYAYIPLIASVRPEDHRFDLDSAPMNSPEVRISTLDGDMAQFVRNIRFPKSQDISLPQTAAITDELLNVVTNKSDIALTDILTASKFLKNNPGSIRIIKHNPPLYMVALSLSLPPDIRLKQMADVATTQLLNTGKVEEILRKYETEPGQFLRVAHPFQIEQRH
ncbi:MAG: transporter substrate-binding domain-containing protein [Alphaproteobacteria bacterium]|nr:transporter substrate-binding domain-containing protein [Alphaproteobacteria bacterium]